MTIKEKLNQVFRKKLVRNSVFNTGSSLINILIALLSTPYLVHKLSIEGYGIYILLTVEGSGGLVHELERRLRVTEPVIKFLSVRIDEEQKRLDKIKKIREDRRKAVAPAASVAEAGGEPAAVTA